MLGDLVIEKVFQLRLMDCYGCLVAWSTVVPGTDGPVGVGAGRCVGSGAEGGRGRPCAQSAGRWPQVPGQMVTVSPRWAVASPGGSRPPPGAAPDLCPWRGTISDSHPAGTGFGGGGGWRAGAAGFWPRPGAPSAPR